MTGYRPGPYWQYTWRYIGPFIMTIILISSIVCMIISNPTYSAWNAAEVCAKIGQIVCRLGPCTQCVPRFSVMQAKVEPTAYPTWALFIAFSMILAGVLPMPIVYLLRRFQILGVDLDIHQGSIRRNETTASTKVMMDDDDVSVYCLAATFPSVTNCNDEYVFVFLSTCRMTISVSWRL